MNTWEAMTKGKTISTITLQAGSETIVVSLAPMKKEFTERELSEILYSAAIRVENSARDRRDGVSVKYDAGRKGEEALHSRGKREDGYPTCFALEKYSDTDLACLVCEKRWVCKDCRCLSCNERVREMGEDCCAYCLENGGCW